MVYMKHLICFLLVLSGCYSSNMSSMNHSPGEVNVAYQLVAQDNFKAGEPVKVKFILENKSVNVLYFLKWYTPFEGLNSDMFKVTLNGVEIPYEGRLVKRGAPALEDYQSVSPGSSIETVLDLSLVYNMKTSGKYSIEFRGKIYDYIYTMKAVNPEKILPTSPDKQQAMDISGNTLNINVGMF
jgi:hypothetical protein